MRRMVVSAGRWRRGNVDRRGPRLQHVVGDASMGEKDPLLARLLAAATAGAPPAGRPSADTRQFVAHLHGGGWTIGGLSTFDRACRRMAAVTGSGLLSVDYRLAPEHPAPAAIDDAIAALEWVASGPPEIGAG